MTHDPSPYPSGTAFLTTRWTRVGLAKANSDEGRKALGDLCGAYYEPVVAYLGSAFRDSEAAREMSHAFFDTVQQFLHGQASHGGQTMLAKT
jgi:RNA polymerase sigma-70 factor (ECF subfamily)